MIAPILSHKIASCQYLFVGIYKLFSLCDNNGMKKYIVRVAWSQTDMGNILLFAKDRKDARKIAREKGGNFCHILGVFEITIDLTL